MTDKVPQPIIIKKVKGHAHAHHGGAWKVAYADFVTAMMAFFLLLWLLNATTEEQKKAIADYFTPSPVTGGQSGYGGLFGGQSMTSESKLRTDGGVSVPMPLTPQNAEDIDEEDLEEIMAERERERFDSAAAELRQAIQSVPELAQLQDSLIIDQTPEGLRIQLVDQERLAMFGTGSATPEQHTRRLLALVAEVINKLSNQISISGHTDATPYRGAGDYSNWELSADRANAARRLLLSDGLVEKRIALVQGKAATDPLLADEPDSPRNRRISIVLLRASETPTQANAAPTLENLAAPGALRPPTTVVEMPAAD